jgi:hypothetical protein
MCFPGVFLTIEGKKKSVRPATLKQAFCRAYFALAFGGVNSFSNALVENEKRSRNRGFHPGTWNVERRESEGEVKSLLQPG